jgi:hypothetical protein
MLLILRSQPQAEDGTVVAIQSSFGGLMPAKKTLKRARRARLTKKVVAIGLLKARRAGVKLGAAKFVSRSAARRRRAAFLRAKAVRLALKRASRRVAVRKALRSQARGAGSRRRALAKRIVVRRALRRSARRIAAEL